MSERICSIEGCTKAVVARGWCGMHYSRWRHHGSATYESIRDDIATRFWRGVERREVARCWPWPGSIHKSGYGVVQVDGKQQQAHRIAYVLTYGQIPEDLEIDHVWARGCERRDCVNPNHLEAVTPQVNTLRGDTLAAANSLKTHCPQGHAFDETNTRWYRGTRSCRACNRERNRRRRLRAGAVRTSQ